MKMGMYNNPIKRRGDFADPYVMKYNGKYYLYCTNPNVKCWSSYDLLNWKYECEVVPENEFPGLVPFAPEIVYHNGSFYMYTSPHGLGHYVLQANNPLGPFHKITGNIGHAIDLSVFVDDNGEWYAYWASEEGILGCRMTSPATFGKERLVGAYLNGWTEGPFVIKSNDTYYMTYTGNHYLSKGYRVHAAVSKYPLGPYTEVSHNPILVKTEGNIVGLGHSSTVLGPDLKTYYIFYHNLNPDRSRDLNISAIEFCSENCFISGINTPQICPELPTFYDYCDSECCEEWDVVRGMWSAENGFRVCKKGIDASVNGKRFTHAEFNISSLDNTNCYGVFFGNENHKISIIVNPIKNSVLIKDIEEVKSLLLPPNTIHTALHSIRVEEEKIFFDSILLYRKEKDVYSFAGYVSDGYARFGYIALAFPGNTVFSVPGIIPMTENTRILVEREGKYCVIPITETVNNDTEYETEIRFFEAGIQSFPLNKKGKGYYELVYEVSACSKKEKYEFNKIGLYDKKLFGKEQRDYCIQAVFYNIMWQDQNSQVGVLLRTENPADGGEGDDKKLGTNFFIGYKVGIKRNKIVISKHRYNEEILAESVEIAINKGKITLDISIIGNYLKVEIDGKQILDYWDSIPIIKGKTGVQARNVMFDAKITV